jgi:hypothetical protein
MLVQRSWCHADGRSQTGHRQHFEFTALGSGGADSLFGGAACVLPEGGALADEGVPEELELPDAVGVPGRAEGGGGVVPELPDAAELPDRAVEGLGGVRVVSDVEGGLVLPGVVPPSDGVPP